MKKLRIGVVGAGYLGRFHAQKYSELENIDLVGVVDIDAEKSASVAAEVKTKAFSSIEEIFGKVDAVSIVTPTETHCKVGLEFLSRGISTLIEKPISVTIKEAEALISEAEARGAVLQVGHLERFNPAVVALAGKVKNPMFIESHRLSPFPHRALDVDVVLDLMIHDIDIILNMVKSEIESVEAVGIPVMSNKIDIANARIKFANGCVADVTASRISKERTRKIRLFQSDAYISIDYAHQKISVSRLKREEGSMVPSIVEDVLQIEKGDSLKEEIISFVDCVVNKKPPLVSGKDGVRALQAAILIQSAMAKSLERLSRHIGKG
ncbi:MAG: Gfo/Idh/MocA family oxidoreductase [Thermodesulfobacteriota bacterium]